MAERRTRGLTKVQRHEERQTRRENRATQTHEMHEEVRASLENDTPKEAEEHYEILNARRFSMRPKFARATEKQQKEAQRDITKRADELYEQKREAGWASQIESWNEADEKRAAEAALKKNRSFVKKVTSRVAKGVEKMYNLEAPWAKQGRYGGSKSKEILGKIRRIYKVAGSRKEHVKYKGELIPVSDYKKLFKK
jgi:hypothetical protein